MTDCGQNRALRNKVNAQDAIRPLSTGPDGPRAAPKDSVLPAIAGGPGRGQLHLGEAGRGEVHLAGPGRGQLHLGEAGRGEVQLAGPGRGQLHLGQCCWRSLGAPIPP